MSVLFAILLFSFLVFIHELGHFMAAKASGVQVNEFAIFMGPAIFKKKVGETTYSLRCIPIGGFCAMEGEDEDTENPRSFQKAAWWKRLIILAAGAAMNFIFGVILFVVVYMPAKQLVVPVITQVEPGCTVVREDGLHLGDEILEVDGEKIYVQADFSMILYYNKGDIHDLVVLRDGKKVYLNDFYMEKHEFSDSDGNTSMRYGFSFGLDNDVTFGDKLAYGWANTVDNIRNVRLSLQMLLTGKIGFSELSGPVGIVDVMSDVADTSPSALDALLNMLWLGGLLAVNLAVMNLLPIPALDGGRIVALLLTTSIEAITKKKINPKYEGYVHAVGMVLLLVLMAATMFKDIIFIFKG
ncbi:MAG: site-2 protease family protein [Oscillospiraceae bacterium]|nr:site-2 protease family protein [Oscillospiraceae bacterium]